MSTTLVSSQSLPARATLVSPTIATPLALGTVITATASSACLITPAFVDAKGLVFTWSGVYTTSTTWTFSDFLVVNAAGSLVPFMLDSGQPYPSGGVLGWPVIVGYFITFVNLDATASTIAASAA